MIATRGRARTDVFLACPSLADAFAGSELEAAARAEAAGRPALVWVTAGRSPRVTVLAHDGEGRVARPVRLPGGLTLPAGASFETALDGPDAGILRFDAANAFDPWVRYSYASGAAGGAGAAPAFGGLAFRLLDAPASAAVRIDPARPLDRERTVAAATAEPVRSRFRTRWGATVTLTARPPDSRYVLAFDPARDELYWTLDGTWGWGVAEAHGAELELMPGVSGAEYVTAPDGCVVRFVADAPAFASGFRADAPSDRAAGAAAPGTAPLPFPLVASAPGVEEPVTTAWTYVEPAEGGGAPAAAGAGYFSQPDRAALFTAGGGRFLDALPLRAADLPAGAATPYAPRASFPAAPWAGLDAGPGGEVERRFEAEVLVAARALAIASLEPPAPADAAAPADTTPPTPPAEPTISAVTPQGLLSTFAQGSGAWERLVLAQAGDGAQQLALTDVRGRLREALLANRLFLVVSDVERLFEHCSTTFCVDRRTLTLAQAAAVPAPVLARVGQALLGSVFATRTRFEDALRPVLGADYAAFGRTFVRYAEQAQLEIAGWSFDLTSWRWHDATAPTILIVKFTDGDLASLIADRSRWTMAAEFNDGDGARAQQTLLEIVADARRRAPAEPELRYFTDTVLGGEATTGGWNGVLYLNPVVPTGTLPPELAALAAGLPTGEVRAHHLGVTLSSFALAGRDISLEDSSLFGLILYGDDEDLVFRGDAYDFKVTSLRVRFANSAIASFSSQVELLIGQLFNELSSLPGSLRGDNLLFEGTLQRGAYRFTTTTQSRFAIASQVLDFVAVADAVFVTVTDESSATRTVARFVLDGTLGFRRFGDVDLFGYGPSAAGADAGLAYAGLMVSMQFDPRDPHGTRRLEFVAGQTTFDLARSAARPGSLPRRFPLVPAALRQSERAGGGDAGRERGATPADLGFLPVDAPLPTGPLADTWFGLELTLSFGSPGGLAPQLGFTGALLLSWAPSAEAPNVAVGLRLPGAQGGGRALALMGPLRLSVGQLRLMRDAPTDGYLLRLASIALSFLGLRFPAAGRANALLFGDPDPNGANSALGWYVAYDAEKPCPTD